MNEDRKINHVRTKETVGMWGTKDIPVFRNEFKEHKSNLKSINRHEKLADKKHKMAAKMSEYKQHAARYEKLAKRF